MVDAPSSEWRVGGAPRRLTVFVSRMKARIEKEFIVIITRQTHLLLLLTQWRLPG